jgi:ribosomal protein S18 acetylase RimI-like enzyme
VVIFADEGSGTPTDSTAAQNAISARAISGRSNFPVLVRILKMSVLLETLEMYYDTVPRSSATAEVIGPFTLFIADGGFPFYARPTMGGTGTFTASDVRSVLERQHELGLPQSFEWVDQNSPELARVAEAAGLSVHTHPLMVLGSPRWPDRPEGVSVRMLVPEDGALASLRAVQHLGFSSPGTDVAPVGIVERDAALDEDDPVLPFLRSRIRSGLSAVAVAEALSGPVGGGSHSPCHGVSELTGIATLPAYRRRGIGAIVAATLVSDAQSGGVKVCFLSAASADVSRTYGKVGFETVGTACIAKLSEPQVN